MPENKSFIYKAFTVGIPQPGEHTISESHPFDVDAPPPPGGFTLRAQYWSLDPFSRGQIRRPTDPDRYSKPWVEGEPAVLIGFGTVLKSDNPRFQPGDTAMGLVPASTYASVPADLAATCKVLPALPPVLAGIPPEKLLTLVGVPGMAAYPSFYEFIPERLRNSDKTIVISAASGGVGQLVGQIAKLHGMRVVGSTSSAEKIEFLTSELGFDAAWNYKHESTADALARLAPEGVDVYYDNTGGEQLETTLLKMNDFGIIISSGAMAEYHKPYDEIYGVKSLMELFFKRLTVYGFICSDPQLTDKYGDAMARDMLTWFAEGKLKTKEELVVGVDHAPEALCQMFKGDKFGKTVLKIDED